MNAVLAPPPARATRPEPVLRPRSMPAPPRALVWVSGLVVIAGVVMGVVGAFKTGITWDEPYHVMRLRNYFGHDWFALDWALGGNGPASPETNTVVYGPVAMLLLHGLTALFGVEGWGEVSTSPAAYDVRHLGVLLIGLVGTGAAAAITRILMGSWRWALVTAATLLALPMWTGHLMFNVKDVPVATGYTLVTLSLIAMVAPVQGHRMLRVAGLAFGVCLMVGTRPAMWTAVVAGLAVLAAGVLVAGRFGNARTALGEAAAGVVAAGIVLALVYPSVFAHPATLLMQSAEQSVSFRGGRQAVYGYIPFFVAAQVPLLLLAFFGIGLVSAAGFVGRRWRTDTSQATRIVLVGVQLLALPLVSIFKHADLYNGLRQLLFAAPVWAVLTTLGLAKALAWARERGRLRVAGAVAVLALTAPVLDQALLFPYQYTYFNAAVDATGVHVPSDYWRTSVPELLPEIPTDGQIVCGPTRSSRLGALAGTEEAAGTDESAMLAGRYSSDSSVDCRTDPLGPLSSQWSARHLPLGHALPHGDFYVLIDRDHAVPANCSRLSEVGRDRHGRDITMTYIARCHLDAPPLGTTPVEFTRTPEEPNMIPGLWAFAPTGWVTRQSMTAIDAGGTSATLAFEAPAECSRTACALALGADGPDDLAASVNGSPAQVVRSDGATVVRLPHGVSDAWVTFTRTSGQDLGLRVHSIRVSHLSRADKR